MILDPVKNFAIVTVSTGYAAGATSIVLSSGDGAKLPAPSTDGAFNLVWYNSSDYPNPADDPSVEIVRCTGRSTDTLTVTRAQEGTADVNHNTGGKTYKMLLSVTKKMIDDIRSGTGWTQTIGTFTATPAAVVIGTITFTFAASTTVTASADCVAQGVAVGQFIWNSTNDTRSSAQQILAIATDNVTITLASAYAGTTGATKQGSVFGHQLTMTSDLTASIKAGMSLMYVISGVTKIGRVGAITSSLLTPNGAPLSGDVTALYYGGGTTRKIIVIIPGTYEDASNTALISSDLKSSALKTWDLPISYCVHYKVYSNTHDTGTHGQASVRINNTELNLTTGGLTIAADATEYQTVVDIDVAAYDINPGEAVEITAVKNGNGDASDLTIEMIIITP